MSSSISSASPRSPAERRRGRWIALGLFVFAALPVLGAFAAYFFWTPASRINHGELIDPVPMPQAPLKAPDGSTFSLSGLKGRWVLIHVGSGRCGEDCVKRHFLMRQVRLMQGREASRVERVWLIVDGEPPDPELLRVYEGMRVGRGDAALLAMFPAPADPRQHVYLADPMGNIVLRFPVDADPMRVSRDIARLLKVSHVG